MLVKVGVSWSLRSRLALVREVSLAGVEVLERAPRT